MGRIPVFLYDDIPWIPYDGTNISAQTYGFTGGIRASGIHTDIRTTIITIANITEVEYQQKIQALRNVRKYFTYEGVFEQFEAFLRDPFGPEEGGQLRCIQHPHSDRCCG